MDLDRNAVIKRIVGIILKFAKPERIYVYGSTASGKADKNSDIDIAYDDKTFKDNYLIEDEVNKIDTLLKIDIKNIAFTEGRFSNRVKTTGRVLFSADIKLRAEDGLYNFSCALKRFLEIIDREDELNNEGYGEFFLDVTVKRFEFTYEMAWKALKRYLDFLGIKVNNPRQTFKEAYAQDIISDESVWLNMIEHRNMSSHIYDESEIMGILHKLNDYKQAFIDLRKSIENGLCQSGKG